MILSATDIRQAVEYGRSWLGTERQLWTCPPLPLTINISKQITDQKDVKSLDNLLLFLLFTKPLQKVSSKFSLRVSGHTSLGED